MALDYNALAGALMAQSGDDFSGDDFSGDDFSGDIIGQLLSAGDDYSGDIIGRLVSAGGDDFAGEDDVSKIMALAGAMNRAKGRRGHGRSRGVNAQALAQAFMAAQIKSKGALSYTPTKYETARDVPIGFDSVIPVPAGATVAITQRPQQPFRPARLFIPSDIAGAVLVNDIKVGNKSQLASNGSLPGRMFQENSVGVNLSLDTCDPAIDLVLSITNISGAPLRFTASFTGPAVSK